jgi:RNA polymerase sigma-70 factor, ECF subfamily
MQTEPFQQSSQDAALVAALKAGDEQAFRDLIESLHPSMLRIARMYVRTQAVAEEVVQETWLAVVKGLDRFEGRSSLKTWILRILANRARTRGAQEGRTVPFSALASAEAAVGGPTVEPARFAGRDDGEWPYHWAAPPRDWPEERLLANETLSVIGAALAELPESQREVVRLRDVEGWDAEDVAEALQISAGNQRVLLHRGRAKVRAALERYFDPAVAA